MSGHSKWAQIKRKKGATDVARGKLFSKLAAAIAVAAKKGGDPATNPSLREAVEKARAANMSKEAIERAIKRGTGELGGAAIEEITYEVFGPGGVAILVKVVTDNRNRASSDIKAVLNKYGGNMGGPGSVAWIFETQAVVHVDLAGKDKGEAQLFAIDQGAEEVREEDGVLAVQAKPENLASLKKAFEDAGYKVISADISIEPKNSVEIKDAKTAAQILKLMDALDELEDVVEISSNFDIPDEIMSQAVK
jgi:YebC/PmpR family DNA-binding regulatory protein